MDKVAVVILNWNGKDFLQRFLRKVIANSKNEGVKIWIVDNGSSDGSVEYLKNEFDEVGLVQLKENHGFTGGYNIGLKQIEAEYYVLLNSDVEVTSNWLTPLIKLMDDDRNIAACMPKIRAYDRQDDFEYAGASGGFIDKFGFPFCRGRIFDNIEKDNGQYDSKREIFWASGAAMFIRADRFREQNGFDNDFFAHMEEIDLCWRLKNSGYKIMIEPNSVVYHVGGGTLPNNSPYKLYLNFRNNLFLLYKNLPQKGFRLTLFKRKIFDGVAALKFLIGFEFKSFMSVAKAHKDYYKTISSLKQKRESLQVERKQDFHKEIYQESIVISYFLKGKREFDDLGI